MTVKELKEELENIDDDVEIIIECGNKEFFIDDVRQNLYNELIIKLS